MSDTYTHPDDEEPVQSSPFDVDMGGHQRAALRSELRGLLIDRKEIGRVGEFANQADSELDAEIARIEATGVIGRARTKVT
jgi:hypothetical protein